MAIIDDGSVGLNISVNCFLVHAVFAACDVTRGVERERDTTKGIFDFAITTCLLYFGDEMTFGFETHLSLFIGVFAGVKNSINLDIVRVEGFLIAEVEHVA